MSNLIIFISRNRVKEGSLHDFLRHYKNSIPITEAARPGTFAQLAYFNEERTEITVVRIFSDADGLDQQLRGADERSKTTYQYIEPTGIEIYGAPSAFALAMMRKVAGSGIPVSVHSEFIGGFIRSSDFHLE